MPIYLKRVESIFITTLLFNLSCQATDNTDNIIVEINVAPRVPIAEASIKPLEENTTYQHSLTAHLNDITNEATSKIREIANSHLSVSVQEAEDQGYAPPRTALDYYRETGKEARYASALSLDGGGFRGLMEAYWLNHLEKKTNRKPHELFNIIAGTSIGGILALGSTIPGKTKENPALSTEEMINLFEINGHKIFPQRWKYNYPGKLLDFMWGTWRSTYDEKPLQDLLTNYFSNKPLSSALTNVLIVSAISETQEPFIFSSFHPDRNHYQAWDAARSTSAAPTYFKAHKLVLPDENSHQCLVDGGLWKNNPSDVVYEAALERWNKDPENIVLKDNIIMLSLGTGKMPVQYRQPENAGWINSVRPLIESLMNYSVNGVDQSMKTILGQNYVRINPVLKHNILLDCIDDQSVKLLKDAAEEEYEKIEKFSEDDRLRHILEIDAAKENKH